MRKWEINEMVIETHNNYIYDLKSLYYLSKWKVSSTDFINAIKKSLNPTYLSKFSCWGLWISTSWIGGGGGDIQTTVVLQGGKHRVHK